MAFSSLFTLLDDIVSVLDDVALMTKTAAKKTVGVVGDDLALNANQVTGVSAERELPIVWAVAKGSFVNKLILVPLALLLSAFLPVLITPLLMIGGVYLCFEGTEKLLHKFFHHAEAADETSAGDSVDEKSKIKGAIRTDFILSAEIIIIALGVVESYDMLTRSAVMASIGIGMTVFVYGLVAVIVKLDDFGMLLMRRRNAAVRALGKSLIVMMPWFMRFLSVAGTVAMFLVGGGLIVHNVPAVHHWLHALHWDSGWMEYVSTIAVGLAAGLATAVPFMLAAKCLAKHR